MAIEQIDGFAARLSWPRGDRGFAAEYRLVQYEKCIANNVCIFQMAHVSVSSHRFIRVVERCQESCMCKRRISLTVAKNKGWVGFCRLLGTTLGGGEACLYHAVASCDMGIHHSHGVRPLRQCVCSQCTLNQQQKRSFFGGCRTGGFRCKHFFAFQLRSHAFCRYGRVDDRAWLRTLFRNETRVRGRLCSSEQWKGCQVFCSFSSNVHKNIQ